MNKFIFGTGHDIEVAHKAVVPAGLRDEAALMDALYEILRFPDYFGSNWDALSECILELSWLPTGNILLVHEDLPLKEDLNSLATYLKILKRAVEFWESAGSRKLIVIFPPETESIIRKLLRFI